jgi:putative colanic acid biosynthesis acetyltransferase WcaF
MTLDIDVNRSTRKYSHNEQLRRVLWGGARVLFRASPRPCYRFRRWLLRQFGATVGASVHISPTAVVYFPWMLEIGDRAAVGDAALLYNLGPLVIGPRATVSQRAHLCGGSHDHTDPAMPLLRLPITVEADAWICADAFVGPGVTVGQGAVVGARAAVFKNVEPWTIVGGNPAKVIGQRKLSGSNEIMESSQ